MGGKHKQAQRTKNNARPSSSGRSAELLGSSLPAFAGFSTVKDGAFVPVLPGFSLSTSEEADTELDNNFQLVLKKMNKKDSVTKLKALQEFAELVNKSDPDVVKNVLAFWPRLYCVLAMDVEHKIREAAHIAQRAIAIKAKRNLAPYLKQIIGPWFTSQYDNYAPAASAAKLAFEDSFSSNKLPEVIVFCQDEILNYIYDNLIVQTVQTLSAGKTLTAEEAEAKYQRVLIASLQGYALYLHKVPKNQLTVTAEANKKIISNNKFWKLSKHKVPLVRSAWFNALSALCQKAQFLLEEEMNRVTTTVMANLDETDSTVLPIVWEAALLALSIVEEWWKHVNIEKLVLPKLWRVLREAGQGNASSIYPNLLPLISKFPPGPTAHVFYKDFFDNMRIGFKQKSVHQSRMELTAVATAFTECLQYVILKNNNDLELCESLLNNQLISLIEWCVIDGHKTSNIIFNQVSVLVHYWMRNQHSLENSHYDHLTKMFWDELKRTCEQIIVQNDDGFDKEKKLVVVSKIVELILCLKRNTHVKLKKHLKVQFSTEKSSESGDVKSSEVSLKIEDTEKMYNKELHNLTYKVLLIYMRLLIDNFDPGLVLQFYTLVREFDTEDLFKYIVEQLYPGTDNITNLILFKNFFYTWLNCDYEVQSVVIDLIFILLKYLESDEKKSIFDSILKLNNEKILRSFVMRCLAHPYRNETVVREWLCTDAVASLLLNSAKSVLRESEDADPDHMLLLKQTCTQDETGELLISKSALENIVHEFCRPLLEPMEHIFTLDTCARFSAVLSAYLYSDINATSYSTELLLALFSLSTNTDINTEILSTDTLWEVDTAWQDAVTIFSNIYGCDSDEFKKLTKTFAQLIMDRIMSCQDFNNLCVERIVKVVLEYIISQTNFEVDNVSGIADIFINHSTEILVHNFHILSDVALEAEIIGGRYSFLDCYKRRELKIDSDFKVDKLMLWFVVVVKLLTKLFQKQPTVNKNQVNDEEDSDNENSTEEVSNKEPILKESTSDLNEEILRALYFYVVANSYMENYRNTKQYNVMKPLLDVFKSELKQFFQVLPTQLTNDITELTINKINSEGTYWVDVFYELQSEFCLEPSNLVDVFVRYNKKCVFEKGWLHLLQKFASRLTYDHVNVENKSRLLSLVVARCIAKSDETVVQTMEALSYVKLLQSNDKKALLYDIDISTCDWNTLEVTVEVIRLFTSIIKSQPFQLSSGQWDFVIIGLASWINSSEKSVHAFSDLKVKMFIASVFELFYAIAEFMKKLENDIAIGTGYKNLISEWNDVVYNDVVNGVINVWLFVIENYVSNEIKQIHFVQVLEKSVEFMKVSYIINDGIKWKQIVKICTEKIYNENSIIQMSAFSMLYHLVSGLVEIDTALINAENLKDLSIHCFKDTLVQTQEIVETMLSDFKIAEDSCTVEPYTDAYAYSNGYLLTWTVLLTMVEKASSLLRYQYADWMRDEDFIKKLLNNLLRLIPAEVLHLSLSSMSNLFYELPSMDVSAPKTSEWLEAYACWVYAKTLSALPALARQWWSGSEARIARIADRITIACVSSQLCAQEMQTVAKQKSQYKNMQVKIHQNAREVTATYTVDEAKMELIITLPANHPLGPVKIESGQQIGAASQWRNSIMQLSLFLTHQNGSIWDGLSLWKSNLDRHFDGVEECYICFSVIHAGTYQLPKLSCQTCRKKFHSACLYKWFSTSNKSTCPICRNLF